MYKIFIKFVTSLTLLSVAAGNPRRLYEGYEDVTELVPENFEKLVIHSDEIWMVQFYATWSHKCRSITLEYLKVATALRGYVKVGVIDANAHNWLNRRYHVEVLPTILIFGLDKRDPIVYKGNLAAKNMAEEALNTLKKKFLSFF